MASTAPLRRSRRSKAASTSAARSLAGKTLPPGSTLVGTPSASNRSTTSWGPRRLRAEWRNRPCGPKASTMPLLVGGVGQVAARAARQEDLHARLAVLLQQQRASPPLGRARGGHQSRRSRTYHDDIPLNHPCLLTRSPWCRGLQNVEHVSNVLGGESGDTQLNCDVCLSGRPSVA